MSGDHVLNICSGESFSLYNVAGPVGGTWYDQSGGLVGNPQNVVLGNAGCTVQTYVYTTTYTTTDADGCPITHEDGLLVTVYPAINASVTGSGSCTVSISACPDYTVSWNDGSNTGAGTTYTGATGTSGSVTFTVTNPAVPSGMSCAQTILTPVLYDCIPTVCPTISSANASAAQVCSGHSISLSASIASPDGGTMIWTENGSVISDPSNVVLTTTNCNSDIRTFTVSYTPSNTTCPTVSETVTVVVHPQITATLTSVDACTVTLSQGCANFSAVWTDSDGNSGTGFVYTGQPGTSGNVTFTVTNAAAAGLPCGSNTFGAPYECLPVNTCEPEGGYVGVSDTQLCYEEILYLEVTPVMSAPAPYGYDFFVVDAAGNIVIGFESGNILDLTGLSVGTYCLYGISYLPGQPYNSSATTLAQLNAGGGCFDLSDCQPLDLIDCMLSGIIGDFVFCDTNGNGYQDAGDTGIPNVTIILNGPGGTQTTQTNANGFYLFTNLTAGEYIVQVDLDDPDILCGGQPAGTLITPSQYIEVLWPGEVYDEADFGFQVNVLSICVDANDDYSTTNENSQVVIPILINDQFSTDCGSDDIVINVLGDGGTVQLNADNTITFTPPAGFEGDYDFYYELICTNTLPYYDCARDTAHVVVQVVGMNNPPCTETLYECTAPITPTVICISECDPDGDNVMITDMQSQFGNVLTSLSGTCFRFTPQPGFLGTDNVTLTVCDDGSPSACATVTYIISIPCTTPPNAVDDNQCTTQSTATVIDVLANDSGDGPFSITIVAAPEHGTAVVAGGMVVYLPDDGFVGDDQFVYQITDANGQTDQATVSVCVEQGQVVCQNFTDLCIAPATSVLLCPECNGLPLDNITNVTSTSGCACVPSGGCFYYIPLPGFTGYDTVVFESCEDGECSYHTFNINVSTSCILQANPDAVATPEGVPVSINILGNDNIPSGLTPTISILNTPSNGTVQIVGDMILYTPSTGFSGTDNFVYQICAGGNCSEAIVTVTVSDDVPCTQATTYCPTSGGVQQICVTFCDVAGAQITNISAGSGGNAVQNGPTCFNYSPVVGFEGVEQVQVTGCNGSDCETVTVSVSVSCTPPNANNDNGFVNIGGTLTLDVSGNDNPTCGYGLNYQLITTPLYGTATLSSNGQLIYTPSVTTNATETLQYQVCNGCVTPDCDITTITITISGTPPTVIAQPDVAFVVENGSTDINVLFNDIGDNLFVDGFTQPLNGTLSDPDNDGILTYTPNPGYIGQDFFTYTVCNDMAECDQTTVSITVFETGTPNQAPTPSNDAVQTGIGSSITIDVLANDTDPENHALTITQLTQPANGTVQIVGNMVEYTPNPGFEGTDVFTYTVCDNGTPSECATATVAVTVGDGTPNQPPIASADNATVNAGESVTIQVLLNDTDPDGSIISINISSFPMVGTAVMVGNEIVYTAPAGYSGTDNFVYVICDDGVPELCDMAVVSITVIGELIPTVIAQPDVAFVVENGSTDIPVLFNDIGDNLFVQNFTQPLNGTLSDPDNDGILTYTPNPGYIGQDFFTYTVCNDMAECDQTTVGITVFETGTPNQAPTPNNDVAQTGIGSPITIDVLANDTDPENHALTIMQLTQPPNGTTQIVGGMVEYTPNPGFEGTDVFTYTVCDNGTPSECATATVAVTVGDGTTPNQPPIANPDNATVDAGDSVNIPVLFNDTDDGAIVSVSLSTLPMVGTATLNGDNTITYAAPTGYNGTDNFIYIACDDGTPQLCDTAVVNITVIGEPVSPIDAEPDIAYTLVNDPVDIPVLANDMGDGLMVDSFTQPENGMVDDPDGDGVLTYTPDSGFIGEDYFFYTVCNEDGVCEETIVAVNVLDDTEPNLPPVANNDVAATPFETSTTIDVLDNDTDPEGTPLVLDNVENPDNGTAEIIGNEIFYTPDAGFEGVDVFNYVVCDGGTPTECATATIAVSVGDAPVNNPPVAVDDSASTSMNTLVSVDVLDNDGDPDVGDILSITLGTNPANGTAVVNPITLEIEYTPDTDFFGVDFFTYFLCDDGVPILCDTAYVTITVLDSLENVAPIAVDDEATTALDTPVEICVMLNDTDPNGDELTITSFTPPANGTTEFSADSTCIIYTPDIGFEGEDTFEYQICDFFGLCDEAEVVVTISENQAPIAEDDEAFTEVDEAVEICVAENDNDPDGDNAELEITDFTQPANGIIEFNSDSTCIIYTPNPDFVGVDTFLYEICDPSGLCDAAEVVVNVLPEGSLVDAQPDVAFTQVNMSIGIPVMANDLGDGIQVTQIVTNPINGGIPMFDSVTGIVIYQPNSDYVGTDFFTYEICDDFGLCDQTIVGITILPDTLENQPPTANNDVAATPQDSSIVICVLDNDTDPNGDELTIASFTQPANGTTEFNADSSCIVYDPNPDFVGVDTFQYVVCDTGGLCDTAFVGVTVGSDELPNNPPVAEDDSEQTEEDTPIGIPVLGNDSDPDGDDISICGIFTNPSNGTAVINGDSIVYTPNPGFNGDDYLIYAICDDGVPPLSDTAYVFITIAPDTTVIDSLPAINETVLEDSSVVICVDDYYTSLPFDVDTIIVTVNPANGDIQTDGDTPFGELTDSCIIYIPTPDYNGPDEATIAICDEDGNCVIIPVFIDVLPVPDAPDAADDLFACPFEFTDGVATPDTLYFEGDFDVLGNDSDIDGDDFSIVSVCDPTYGDAFITPDGVIGYVLTFGLDSSFTEEFCYVIEDETGLVDTALITFNCDIINTIELIALDDVDTTAFGESVDISILPNDSICNTDMSGTVCSDIYPDGVVAFDLTIVTTPDNGAALVNDTTITYIPNPGFSGVDQFEYEVCYDGVCDVAVVTVIVLPPDCALKIPNGFSPNDDGMNDTYVIPNIEDCFENNELMIFNRWGDEVFKQQNYSEDNAWDGTHQRNNKLVPDGTYFYILKLNDGKDVENGYIEICR